MGRLPARVARRDDRHRTSRSRRSTALSSSPWVSPGSPADLASHPRGRPHPRRGRDAGELRTRRGPRGARRQRGARASGSTSPATRRRAPGGGHPRDLRRRDRARPEALGRHPRTRASARSGRGRPRPSSARCGARARTRATAWSSICASIGEGRSRPRSRSPTPGSAAAPIVRTKGPTQDESREATPDAPLEAVPTVVLVNWATASAAEVVAAALQDTQAGILVGERTFGKGVVQEVVEFESWPGGMKLTTGRMFSPAGRCVDRGVRPRRARPSPGGSSRISSSRCPRWIPRRSNARWSAIGTRIGSTRDRAATSRSRSSARSRPRARCRKAGGFPPHALKEPFVDWVFAAWTPTTGRWWRHVLAKKPTPSVRGRWCCFGIALAESAEFQCPTGWTFRGTRVIIRARCDLLPQPVASLEVTNHVSQSFRRFFRTRPMLEHLIAPHGDSSLEGSTEEGLRESALSPGRPPRHRRAVW